uniref:TF-B3 domain-containing protein n=1 Tax=Chenopodium quinoa TaxID=63459 RepID=A0A803LLS6_CHEQI
MRPRKVGELALFWAKGVCEERSLLSISTDGAWKMNKGGRSSAGIGWVIMKEHIEIVRGGKAVMAHSPLHSEMLAIKEGLLQAQELTRSIEVCTDSMEARKCLQHPNDAPWEVRRLAQDINKDGWEKFVSDHGIEVNDILVFCYTGDSSFKVSVFDGENCCEREGSHFASNTSSSSQNVTCSSSLHFKRAGDNNGLVRKIIKLSLSTSLVFGGGEPGQDYITLLQTIPKKWAIEHMVHGPQDVKLQVGDRSWIVGYRLNKSRNKDGRGMHWINKDTIQLPKGSGGLGVRSMSSLNRARSFDEATLIASMELREQELDDLMYWLGHKSGRYTVKSGYAFIKRSMVMDNSHHYSDFLKTLWLLEFMPKWKLFMWKLLCNDIATKRNLGRRGLQTNTCYDLCSDSEEDLQHIFRFCSTARNVWRGGILGIHLEANGDQSFIEWFLYYIRLFISQDGRHGHRVPLSSFYYLV